jgi:hypothetical protein
MTLPKGITQQEFQKMFPAVAASLSKGTPAQGEYFEGDTPQ